MHDYPSGIARHDRDAERVRIASAHRFAPNRETYLQYPDNAVCSVRKSPLPIRLKVQKTQMFRILNRGAHDEGSGNPENSGGLPSERDLLQNVGKTGWN